MTLTRVDSSRIYLWLDLTRVGKAKWLDLTRVSTVNDLTRVSTVNDLTWLWHECPVTLDSLPSDSSHAQWLECTICVRECSFIHCCDQVHSTVRSMQHKHDMDDWACSAHAAWLSCWRLRITDYLETSACALWHLGSILHETRVMSHDVTFTKLDCILKWIYWVYCQV